MKQQLIRTPIDSVETMESAFNRLREAQKQFSTYTQEQVDAIFLAAATAANKARIPLAKLAVEETGMGVVEDKVIKNHYASEYIYNAYRNMKTCGVIEEDKSYGIVRIAEPVGIIAAVIPTTNPTSTAIFKTLIALKTRNGILISPHPRAKRSTIEAARIVLDAAVAAGAPEGIIDWVDAPSLELTNLAMKEADIILATGGPGMVKSAYSSGKPAIGVGSGNVPAIIDDSADILSAVSSIILSKTFDNGMICASEQSVIVLDSIYNKVKKEFVDRGCYVLKGEETEKVRKTILINGALNAKIVGQSAYAIAKLAGVNVPEATKILIGEVESLELSEEFAHEKLSPVLAMYHAKDFEEALVKAERLIADGGYGHTASVYLNPITEKEKLAAYTARMKTCRILINTPSAHGGIGDLYNFKLLPSLTLGCGSWGGNSVSENVGPKHLLNIKTVAERKENMLWFRTPEKVYFKRGSLPVALDELKNVLGKKRAFLVTDTFLYENGYTKPVTDKLDELGLAHETFFNVLPDPTLASAREGAKQIATFKPDVIIALGGGSAMDAAKIMWVLYEHPEADFMDMAMRFADIRKRVYTFPKMGEKAYFIAIPTTAGTGSEVTPFAVITDETTGVKYPLADYELMPDMAIVDADMMMDAPKGLTAASGIDAVTHNLEAYASMLATDFTDGTALRFDGADSGSRASRHPRSAGTAEQRPGRPAVHAGQDQGIDRRRQGKGGPGEPGRLRQGQRTGPSGGRSRQRRPRIREGRRGQGRRLHPERRRQLERRFQVNDPSARDDAVKQDCASGRDGTPTQNPPPGAAGASRGARRARLHVAARLKASGLLSGLPSAPPPGPSAARRSACRSPSAACRRRAAPPCGASLRPSADRSGS